MEEQVSKQSKPWGRLGLIAVFICLAAAAATWFVIFQVNQFTYELCMAGESDILLEFGEAYTEPGASIMVYGTLFWKEGRPVQKASLEISGEVQEDTLGRYILTYRGSYRDWTTEKTRTVCIIDTECPVITLEEDPEGALLVGQAYRHSGFTAMDNYDGDITDRVVCTVENSVASYSVIDSSGNPAYAEREIPTYDIIPPDIILEGGTEMVVTVGDYTADPGYIASDNLDGDISDKVTITGEINWLIPGTYSAAYSVADAYGNTASVTRSVEVIAKSRPQAQWPYGKVIYLTFDDGPGPYTTQLLDVLDRYGVKATFFVTDSGYDHAMREIVRRGHSIGIHTVSHNYSEIYASPQDYFNDLKAMQEIIYEITGTRTTLMRFPGGSSNTVSYYSYHGLMTFLTEAVQDAGFQYFDWNVDSDDAGKANKTEKVIDNVIEGIQRQGVSAVLQHDTNPISVDAVEDIIIWGMNNGYTFQKLTETSPGFHHSIRN